MQAGSLESVVIRRGWRINEESEFAEHIAYSTNLHQEVTTHNREAPENEFVYIGDLPKRLWVTVCLQAFTTVFSRGLMDARVLGRRPFDFTFPLMYVVRQMVHFHEHRSDRINVGVSIRRSDTRPDQMTLVFNFRNPAADDLRFYAAIVMVALEGEGAEFLFDHSYPTYSRDYEWHSELPTV